MTRILLLTLILITSAVTTLAAKTTERIFKGIIGNEELSVKALVIEKSHDFIIPKDTLYVAITELYPTDSNISMDYIVTIPGNTDFHRNAKSTGFGKLTYFIKLDTPCSDNRITIKGNNSKPVIANVTGVRVSDLEKLAKSDSFIISGLIPSDNPDSMEKYVKELAEGLPSFAEKYNISKGISTEIKYAAHPNNILEDLTKSMKELSLKYNMKTILGIVSWWSGTPLWSDDGEGGKFGDIKHQQICYNPDIEFDYDPELAILLGNKYNKHYKKTIPNIWSNTPWLTMNSKSLNNYRYEKIKNIFNIIEKTDKKPNTWLTGIFIENEPKYWDMITDNSTLYNTRLWADFNPYTVADAKKDGIDLDPTDGLSKKELLWLHANVARYNQESANAANKEIKTKGLDVNLYSHTLYQGFNVFPCNMLENKPASEWGYVKGARTGLESCTIPMLPSNLYRVREWGPWTNLNREENDGMPIELHLWDLRVTYMCGGDYYNSYNWNTIGKDRFINYTKEFQEDFPIVEKNPAQINHMSGLTYQILLPPDMLSFRSISIKFNSEENIKKSCIKADFIQDNGEIITSKNNTDIQKGENEVNLTLPIIAESQFDKNIILHINVYDKENNDISSLIHIKNSTTEAINLKINLYEERLLSLFVINN